MKRLIVKYKTGYRNITGGNVVILDEEYKPFYDTRLVNSKVWEFNLPPGIYYLQMGKISQRHSPVEYTLEKLPRFTRNLQGNPEQFPIIYGRNNYTASVFWDKERSPFGKCAIFLDNSMKEKTKPDLMFILYHECAHKYYDRSKEEEAACDAYAANRMLEEGYNPSQINKSIIMTLSEHNGYRVDRMLNSLSNK